MAYEVVVPRLGLTMDEARVVEWYRQNGESIEAGEPLYAVETDKMVQDVEAPVSGIVYRLPELPGTPMPVGTVIAYLLKPGEKPPLEVSVEGNLNRSGPVISKLEIAAAESTGQAPPEVKLASPAARRRARELGIDWRSLARPDGKPILKAQVEQAARQPEPPRVEQFMASPVARRMAEDAGVKLEEVAAVVNSEKITKADVEAYLSRRQAQPAAASPVDQTVLPAPMSQVRQVIALRMAESAHTTAPVTLTTEADATELVSARQSLGAAFERRGWLAPSYTELMVKLVCTALQEHPALNATFEDECIELHQEVHIAIAVDTEAGLIAPVIREVHTKSLKQISEEARRLVDSAHLRRLAGEDLLGGTFTITNLGMFGIDAFTPIINLPQSAILGIGRITSRPAVVAGQVLPREMMVLSLTFDHRVVDGGPAARFLDTVRAFVENPYLWMAV